VPNTNNKSRFVFAAITVLSKVVSVLRFEL